MALPAPHVLMLMLTRGQIQNQTGPLAFYKGMSAAIFRQCTYGTVRLGLFR
jgi:hypothetical protein